MDAIWRCKEKWLKPGSPGLLAVLLAAGALFAWVWTQLGYRGGNLERQGIDIAHHAILVQLVNEPGRITPESLGGLADYPSTSHRLAAFALPLFGGDGILALRFAALTTVTLLLALQFTLLCRFLPGMQALLVLLLWQALCCVGKVSNPNHFWDGMYNYSRAVGALGLWGGLVCLTAPASSLRGRFCWDLLAVAGAAFAFACHVVPGAVAFGGIGLYALTGWLPNRSPDRLFLLLLTLLAAAGMYWGTSVWQKMVESAAWDGWLPVGPLPLLLTWIPLAGLAAFLLARSVFHARTMPAPTSLPSECLMTALLSAGALQCVTYVRMVLWGACAPYAVKTLFYYTFPLAGLLAALWMLPLTKRLPASWRVFLMAVQRRKLPHVLAGALLAAGVVLLYHQDRGLRTFVRLNENSTSANRFYPPPDRLPQAVARNLQGAVPGRAHWYYFDPHQPVGAFYASIVALQVDFPTAMFCRDHLAAHDLPAVLANPGVPGVLLPAPEPERFREWGAKRGQAPFPGAGSEGMSPSQEPPPEKVPVPLSG